MAHLDGDAQHLVQGEEDRQRRQHHDAAQERIDPLALVVGEGLLLGLLRVVLEAGPDPVDLRLGLLHLGGRLVALVGGEEHQQAHADGEQEDGHAEVAHVLVEELQHREDDRRQRAHPLAPVDGPAQLGDAVGLGVLVQQRDRLGAGEQVLGLGGLLARLQHMRRAQVAGIVDVQVR